MISLHFHIRFPYSTTIAATVAARKLISSLGESHCLTREGPRPSIVRHSVGMPSRIDTRGTLAHCTSIRTDAWTLGLEYECCDPGANVCDAQPLPCKQGGAVKLQPRSRPCIVASRWVYAAAITCKRVTPCRPSRSGH